MEKENKKTYFCMRVCLVDQFAIYMLIPSTIQSTYYNVKVFLFMGYVTIVRVSECVEENQRERENK